jgi:DNA segregation ATPase FtsK/SpoIIIE-like protein
MTVSAEDLDTARKLACEKPSTSYLQRKMLISYTDAMILMDLLEEEGTVSPRNAAGLRTVLRTSPLSSHHQRSDQQ